MSFFRLIHNTMKQNADRHRGIKLALTLCFPVFIVLMTELNQMHSLARLIDFIVGRPTVFLFDILLVSAVYATLVFLSKRVYLSVFITGLMLTIMSYVEFYKYGSTGTHFAVTDLAMSFDLNDLGQFTNIYFSPLLFVSTVLMLTYFFVTLILNTTVDIKAARRIMATALIGGLCAIMIVSPVVSAAVYDAFEVDTENDLNVFMANEKFDQNELIAYFAQSISKQIVNKVEEPESYTEESVIQALSPSDDFLTDSFDQPNVIVVLSESYADFRQFDVFDIDEDIYAGYDKVKNEGYEGETVVPTIGGYTVMTEFELMFGLPVKSLNGFTMPQYLLDDDQEQTTFAQYFQDLGYSTTYMHPFNSTFYSRDEIYSNYGYDQMLFADDLEQTFFRQYIDDKSVFSQIADALEQTEDPSFIFTTTMQNHKPYEDEEHPDDELNYYLEGVQNTSDGYAEFTDRLKELDEPTIVLFMGDHYPCFNAKSQVYDVAGIDSDNCYMLYEQSYLLWSNYDVDWSLIPDERFSAFYLPHLITKLIDAPQTDFTTTMLEKLEYVPRYTQTGYEDIPADDELDLLTYDRVRGDRYSYEEVQSKEYDVVTVEEMN